jgi:hypothetical protein
MPLKPMIWVTAVTVTAGLLFAACSGTAHIEKDKNTDFSKYRTYSWVEKTGDRGGKKSRRNDLTETNIRNAVNAELQKKGWVETRSKPDVILNYELVVEKNQKEQQDAVYSQPYTRSYYNRSTGRVHTFYYPSQFVGYDSYSTTVKEGTVTITMIDSNTDKTVWQGWTTSELNSGNITGREIDKNVKTIFKKFDAGK